MIATRGRCPKVALTRHATAKGLSLEAIHPANLSHLSLVFGRCADDFPTDLRQRATDLILAKRKKLKCMFQHILRYLTHFNFSHLKFDCFCKESAC